MARHTLLGLRAPPRHRLRPGLSSPTRAPRPASARPTSTASCSAPTTPSRCPPLSPLRQILCVVGVGMAVALAALVVARRPRRLVSVPADDSRHRSVFRSPPAPVAGHPRAPDGPAAPAAHNLRRASRRPVTPHAPGPTGPRARTRVTSASGRRRDDVRVRTARHVTAPRLSAQPHPPRPARARQGRAASPRGTHLPKETHTHAIPSDVACPLTGLWRKVLMTAGAATAVRRRAGGARRCAGRHRTSRRRCRPTSTTSGCCSAPCWSSSCRRASPWSRRASPGPRASPTSS